jgi:hypothetical protein
LHFPPGDALIASQKELQFVYKRIGDDKCFTYCTFSQNAMLMAATCNLKHVIQTPHDDESRSDDDTLSIQRDHMVGCSMIGPVLNLHLAAPPRGDGLQRTSTPNAL